MATREEIVKSLVLFGIAHPKEASHYKDPAVMELWVTMLSDLPSDLLMQAVHECIATLTWFPKIAEVRQAAFDIQQAIDPIPDAHTAWGEVLRELDRVGHCTMYGQELRFSHPLIRAVAEQFNWQRLCESENLVSDRAQFIQAYNNRRETLLIEARRLGQTRRFIALKAGEQKQLLGESNHS